MATLTQSLATLTAEKSRMEEAFQADKKVTREKVIQETSLLIQQIVLIRIIYLLVFFHNDPKSLIDFRVTFACSSH